MRFRNRREAGRLLGERLLEFKLKNPVVFGIPRGGVVVAYEVSKILNSPLDVVVSSKIPHPMNPEFAIGAISEEGVISIRERVFLDEDILENRRRVVKEKIEKFREGKSLPSLNGKTAIVVDDGLATGETMLVSILALKKRKPDKIVCAVPVSSIDAKERIEREVDIFVSLLIPDVFFAVGQFYEDFGEVRDEEVMDILKKRGVA
ncbi:MAG: phosphoribosyltransferase [Caldiserica bacterium]|nr:MAG: phosphoribosyltransferase [Caldisericota bacterium]